MCFEGSSVFRLCLGKLRVQAGLGPDGLREGTCDHTERAPWGRWNGGAQSGGRVRFSQPAFSAGRLHWQAVLNLGESQVCFVKGSSIPLPAPPESLHLPRSFEG